MRGFQKGSEESKIESQELCSDCTLHLEHNKSNTICKLSTPFDLFEKMVHTCKQLSNVRENMKQRVK